MSNQTAKLLFDLAEADRRLVMLTNNKTEITNELSARAAKLQSEKARVRKLEEVYRQKAGAQAEEERQLKEAEKKVIERRKQVGSMTGAKAAKYAEREIDVEARNIQAREEKMLLAMEAIQAAERDLKSAADSLAQLELASEAETPKSEERLKELSGMITNASAARERILQEVDKNVLRLYDRVRTKYPASPVALASNGSCQTCFRAIPAQIYNEVLKAEKLIQCPSCSRILVASPEEPKEEGQQ